jgi:hypothetical protein
LATRAQYPGEELRSSPGSLGAVADEQACGVLARYCAAS